MNPRTVITLLLVALAAGAPGAAGGAAWSEHFAGDSSLVAFYTTDARVLRGPFHLGRHQDLSAPGRGGRAAGTAPWTLGPLAPSASQGVFRNLAERLNVRSGPVRIKASPRGERVAWIERDPGSADSRLWIAGADSVAVRAVFMGARADHFDLARHEPTIPTTRDPRPAGPRFIAPSPWMLGYTMTTLAWTVDGKAVIIGAENGLFLVPVSGDSAEMILANPVVALDALRPSPLFRADVLLRRGGSWVWEPYLLHPAKDGWETIAVPGFDLDARWTASRSAVWWLDGKRIRSLRVHDPRPATEMEAGERIAWLHFEPRRGALLWAEGRRLFERQESEDAPRVVLATGTSIRSVLEIAGDRRLALVLKDSLLIWDPGATGSPASSATCRARLAGLHPDAAFADPGGAILVAEGARDGGKTRLARVDVEGHRLVGLAMPRRSKGMLFRAPGGRDLLLVQVGHEAPARLQAYDMERNEWVEVDNPGIAGWEAVEARTP